MKIKHQNNKFNKIYYLKLFIFVFLMFFKTIYGQEHIYTLKKPSPHINAPAYILIDYDTNTVLLEKNANVFHNPASLVKIMTSYVIGQVIKLGLINRNDIVKIGKNAWATGNNLFHGSSLMFLKEGDSIPVHDLIKGIILQSGNDACVAMAEYISKSQDNFVNLMNLYAKELGLNNTCFKNVHGLDALGQYTTAKDIALLGRALIHNLPEEYSIYKIKHFTFNNIYQTNRNKLLWDKNLHVDGIKTGHTENAGYNLIVSAKKYNMRLIAVVLGENSIENRMKDSKTLLCWGFKNFHTIHPLKKHQKIASLPILYGKYGSIKIGVNEDIHITFLKTQEKDIKIMYHINNNKIFAPIYKNQILGYMCFIIKNHIVKIYPLIALYDLPEGNIFIRLLDYIRLLLSKWLHQ
ncbi:serine hydrolase [Enterobacteriaceae endosymbiont of Neohaemonia nigricornis]|uniref:serine hydrolase n=1 Tax=Enterobacteriaceae endosymbiont of Neohaemonia nigricornis TaxID=2675792 RepID=UPI001448F905|nr:serine hydrolase [Enterobacteriaceae endosymbiont of Neohaemonia nigricornis]QJC30269.1 serine-type D-Ala-D-Ala carboxypeptidase [Enterobacteriaceae endosymbiont of Neohaemonia nigricornis]